MGKIEKIKDSRTLKTGSMNQLERLFMKKINENMVIDPDKPYNYIKPIKTTTEVHGCIFEHDGHFYVATQKLMWRGPETVHIYKSNEKGTFRLGHHIFEAPFICDNETAIDMWIESKTV